MQVRSWLPSALVVCLAIAAACLCVIFPPQIDFEPRPLYGLIPVVVCIALGLFPGRTLIAEGIRVIGVTGLWSILLWCVLSQPYPLVESLGVVLAQRAFPVVLVAGVWACLWLPRSWQHGAVAATAIPTLLALCAFGWVTPPTQTNFQPLYLAVDHHQTLYVTDRNASVIRIFAPDGSLRAKLWPGLASRQGAPGPGFSPPGPYADPDQLGIAAATGQTANSSLALWTPEQDPFAFCGLAVDDSDRLYVPDRNRSVMLRFTSDGKLESRWRLPDDFQPSFSCVAVAAHRVYVADVRGGISIFSSQGDILDHWSVPEQIRGGVSVSRDGHYVFVIGVTHLYTVDAETGAQSAIEFSEPNVNRAVVAVSSDRVLVANLVDRRIDMYCNAQHLCGQIGAPGAWPGEFSQLGGLAVDSGGRIYVADYGHSAVQCFAPAGHIAGLLWSVEDEGHD